MKRQFLCAVFVLALIFSASAHGATLDVRGGQLFGAFDVDVGGVLYDVQFQDGTCIELFGGCDEYTDFPFTDPSDPHNSALAELAAWALLDQVFLDTHQGNFDTSPSLVNGIGRPMDSFIITPLFGFASTGGTGIVTTSNFTNENIDGVSRGGGNRDLDTRPNPLSPHNDRSVYAVWSESVPVPIPPSLLLMFSGLVSVLGFRGLLRNRLSR